MMIIWVVHTFSFALSIQEFSVIFDYGIARHSVSKKALPFINCRNWRKTRFNRLQINEMIKVLIAPCHQLTEGQHVIRMFNKHTNQRAACMVCVPSIVVYTGVFVWTTENYDVHKLWRLGFPLDMWWSSFYNKLSALLLNCLKNASWRCCSSN